MSADMHDEAAGALVEICHRLSDHGLVVAMDGNVSVRLPGGNILVTPSGINKGMVTRDDLVELLPDGSLRDPATVPTSEIGMHLRVYAMRSDVNAVCHAHPPFATAFAVAGIPLDQPVLPEMVVHLGDVPLAPFAIPSTKEVADSILPFVETRDAILLANHGVLTCGEDLYEAYFNMEKVEHAAAVLYRAAMLGGPRTLTADQVDRLRAVSKAGYGRRSGGL
ncbi:MAG: class II aldolase/adducin family protein [Ignavibacteria bacterium]|nr:class II aldolase/adducin family protein [Ignavibacteria bacterium]